MNHKNLLALIASRQFNVDGRLEPSLRDISRQTKVVPSTFTRLRHGKDMSAEALLKLILWLSQQGYSYSHIIEQIVEQPARKGRRSA